MSTIFLDRVKSELASQIIKDEFGQELSEFFNEISKLQPYATLKIIQEQKTLKDKYTQDQIKEFLILLLKNGLIVSKIHNSETEKLQYFGQTLYVPEFTNIFGFLRQIKYINHTKSLFGQEAGLVIEFLVNNSCGTVEDCIEEILEQNNSGVYSKQGIKIAFLKLVKNNYLMRDIQQQEDPTEQELQFQPQNQSKATKNKRKNQSNLEDDKELDEMQQKQKKIQFQNQNLQGMNFLQEMMQNPGLQQMVLSQMGNNKINEDMFAQMPLQQQQNQTGDNQRQTIEEELESEKHILQNCKQQQQNQQGVDKEDDDAKSNQYYNFYINHRRFIHDFRTKEITQIVEGKVGDMHRYIIQAILEKSQKIGRSKDFKKTERLTLQDILQILPSQLRTVRESDIKDGLDKLRIDGVHFIGVEHINAQTHYSVEVKKIIKNIQFRHIAKVVERKYTVQTARIFRILKTHKAVDENLVSQLSLMTQDQVRSSLQTLVKDGFLEYHNASEKDKQIPLIQMYTYNKSDIHIKIQEFYLKAIFNLKVKLSDQYAKSKQIEESQNKRERSKEWQKIIKMIKTLEIAIMDLDSALLCFTEY